MIFNCNFSLEHYFDVLDYAKKSYKIGMIKDFYKLQKNNRFMILRHDVDFSIDISLELAKLEMEHGISSTYFILLQSQYYNALSDLNIGKIKQFLKFGHEIGLHYDLSPTKSDEQALDMIVGEAKLLENLIDSKITSISPHNVSLTSKKITYDHLDFIDATDPKILNSVKYVSDSVQNWRNGCMCNYIDNESKLIILTHPIWWMESPNSREKILSNFETNQMETVRTLMNETKLIQQSYLEKLKKE
jgi:hypothetical protein